MKRSDGNRARLGALVLAVALGAAAMLALPGLGIGKGHHRPGEAAGTIQSFDKETGQLVIDLTKGDTISALVTPRTHIRCGDEGRRRHGQPHSLRHGQEGEGSGAGPSEGDEGPPLPPRGEGPPRGRGPSGDDSSGDDPQGEDQGDNHGFDGNRSERCLDKLVVGAVVQGAQIVLIDGNAFYKDVGLAPPAPVDDTE